jgi:solute carrier family 35, member F5
MDFQNGECIYNESYCGTFKVFNHLKYFHSLIYSSAYSFFGVALVANSDRSQSSKVITTFEMYSGSPILGDSLALGSAIFYALYITLLKSRIQDESRINMPLFFGFVGLFNIFVALPAFLFLHFVGIETLEWPNAPRAWATIMANVSVFYPVIVGR